MAKIKVTVEVTGDAGQSCRITRSWVVKDRDIETEEFTKTVPGKLAEMTRDAALPAVISVIQDTDAARKRFEETRNVKK